MVNKTNEMLIHKRFVRHTLKDSWKLIKGSKWAFFICLLFLGIIGYVGGASVDNYADHLSKIQNLHLRYLYWPFISSIISTPFLVGAFMLGIRRARQQTVLYYDGLRYFPFLVKAGLMSFVTYIMANLINLIFYYLAYLHTAPALLHTIQVIAVVYMIVMDILLLFTLPLLVDKKRPFWQCIWLSIITVWPHFWPCLRLMVCVFLIMIIGTLLLGIGVIWAFPWSFIAIGQAYEQLFSST